MNSFLVFQDIVMSGIQFPTDRTWETFAKILIYMSLGVLLHVALVRHPDTAIRTHHRLLCFPDMLTSTC